MFWHTSHVFEEYKLHEIGYLKSLAILMKLIFKENYRIQRKTSIHFRSILEIYGGKVC